MSNRSVFLAILSFIIALPIIPAYAQLNNKPFAFHTPDGGPGMSTGGMQAIINQKVLGVTPDNLVRSPEGDLLEVTKGPGGSAITTDEAGASMPTYKGWGWKNIGGGSNASMSAGTFNAYFTPADAPNRTSYDYSYDHIHSGAVVSTWTTRVVSGQPVSFLPGTPVDTWTGAVSSLEQ